MTRVMVTDGETRTALATVRSLGRAGHSVWVTASRLPSLAGASRFTSHAAQVLSPLEDAEAAVEQLGRLARDHAIEVLIPITDATMRAVLRDGSDRVGGAVIAGPGRVAFESLADKGALLARATDLGLAVPRSVVAPMPTDLHRAVEEVGYPCVLKPHRSVVESGAAFQRFAVRYAARPDDVRDPYPEIAYPLLVQERVVGPGEGVFLLMHHGKRVAAFAHRRLREKPPSGGVSVYRESIQLPSDLLGRCDRMLQDCGWHGPAMVEFKRSTRTGRAYLMELNGRLWGSLQLAIDAGVDFPALLVESALGREPRAVEKYELGVRSRWFWGDVDHLLARLLHSRQTLCLGPEAPSIPKVLWEFLQFGRRGDRFEVLRRDDLRPFLRETVDWFRGRGS